MGGLFQGGDTGDVGVRKTWGMVEECSFEKIKSFGDFFSLYFSKPNVREMKISFKWKIHIIYQEFAELKKIVRKEIFQDF